MLDLLETQKYAGKSLVERTSGKFYTPDFLADHLAQQVLLQLRPSLGVPLPQSLSICDPFCGDGQLILPFLARLARSLERRVKLTVVLRDQDLDAVTTARNRVAEAAKLSGLSVQIDARACDSFSDFDTARHDVVLTNPPWEQLKPDTREMEHLSSEGRLAYERWLRRRSAELDTLFPDAKAAVQWGSWGTSLARCGWEVSLSSCRPGGVLGIILPGSLFADRASTTMRRSVLARSALVDLSAFPPEARLFAKVDQPVLSAVFVVRNDNKFDVPIRLYDGDRSLAATHRLLISNKRLESSDWVIPIGHDPDFRDALSELEGLPTFRDLEGSSGAQLWAGRELDETRVAQKLESSNAHPFVKGRMITRRGVVESPTLSVRPDLVSRFKSVSHERLVWRDVARSTQRRRMISTLIPSQWVAGNSLHVAHFRDSCPIRLRALHAVISSVVFEAQVRSMSSTGHMSLGVVRAAKVPELTAPSIKRLADADRSAKTPSKERQSEVEVAKAYGLSRDAFAALLTHLPKIIGSDREALLDVRLWKTQ